MLLPCSSDLLPLGSGANDSTSSGETKPRSTQASHLARAGESEAANLLTAKAPN